MHSVRGGWVLGVDAGADGLVAAVVKLRAVGWGDDVNS